MTPKSYLAPILGVGIAAGLLAAASTAGAQTMAASASSYKAGYGRTAGSENQPVNVSLTDGNGNLLVVNGIIQAPRPAACSPARGPRPTFPAPEADPPRRSATI